MQLVNPEVSEALMAVTETSPESSPSTDILDDHTADAVASLTIDWPTLSAAKSGEEVRECGDGDSGAECLEGGQNSPSPPLNGHMSHEQQQHDDEEPAAAAEEKENHPKSEQASMEGETMTNGEETVVVVVAAAAAESIGEDNNSDADNVCAPTECSCEQILEVDGCISPPPPPPTPPPPSSETEHCKHIVGGRPVLSWTFRDGRLVFEVEPPSSPLPLNSRTLNRRPSHLRPVTAAASANGKQDSNDEEDEDDFIPEVAAEAADLCQFDVRSLRTTEDDAGLKESPSTTTIMSEVEDSAVRSKHNPDAGNLRSVLKRPGVRKTSNASSCAAPHRVVFNETKNEFFEADYIILIREECDYDDGEDVDDDDDEDDDEDDEEMCTCNQHEMVTFACCDPHCNCHYEDGYDEDVLLTPPPPPPPPPQSPKLAPPVEFVDAVTLSPPDGYKDMELSSGVICQECTIQGQYRLNEVSTENGGDEVSGCVDPVKSSRNKPQTIRNPKKKADQSQQTTPTTPPPLQPPSLANYPNSISKSEMAKTEEPHEDTNIEGNSSPPYRGSPISGILKGGRLWKQPFVQNSIPVECTSQLDQQKISESDDEAQSSQYRRSVRFTEDGPRETCDGAPSLPNHTESVKELPSDTEETAINKSNANTTEMTLTFKLGHHVIVSNNSLKPNSAVRQLFPCTSDSSQTPVCTEAQQQLREQQQQLQQQQQTQQQQQQQQYLVTAESLRAFDEAKRAKLPQLIQSGETDSSIKRAIEKSTLRRSLMRYEPRSSKRGHHSKMDNSLVERIKQLTCNVDEPNSNPPPNRSSPQGQEQNTLQLPNSNAVNTVVKGPSSPSASSSSTSSSSMSSSTSDHKKLAGRLFHRNKHKISETNIQQQVQQQQQAQQPPDLGVGEALLDRRQVVGRVEDIYCPMTVMVGDRNSVATSIGTEYSLEDIEAGLRSDEELPPVVKCTNAPDVIAGTPSALEPPCNDELALFVQQDASRIERIKQKYHQTNNSTKGEESSRITVEDDEHDDYGFNQRPSVRGIRARFSTTNEILQQIQDQLQPPAPTRTSWPYYPETETVQIRQQAPSPPPSKHRPTSLYEYPVSAATTTTTAPPPPLVPQQQNYNSASLRWRVTCSNPPAQYNNHHHNPHSHHHHTIQRTNHRPQSPPPLDISRTYHHTMFYIPYEQHAPPNAPMPMASYYHHHQHQYHHQPQVHQARATQTPVRCPIQQQQRHSYAGGVGVPVPPQLVIGSSPTKHYPQQPHLSTRFFERGAPEGAASVSPHDLTISGSSVAAATVSDVKTSPQGPPLYYTLNV